MKEFLKSFSLKYQNTTVHFIFFKNGDTGIRREDTNFHKHFSYELHFATKGTYEYEQADRKLLFRKNEMLIIPPGILHKAIVSKDGNFDFKTIMLKFDADESDEIINKFTSVLDANSQKTIVVSDELINIVEEIYRLLDNKKFLSYLKLNSLASEFIYSLMAFLYGEDNSIDISSKEDLMLLIEGLVNLPDVNISQIAESIHYSVRQTERIIKKIYGKSLAEIREDFDKTGEKNEKKN